MQQPSWLSPDRLNCSASMPHFWSGGSNRKRKGDVSDLDERCQNKVFLTEEKLADNMRALSLDLSADRSTTSDVQQEGTNENVPTDLSATGPGTHYELHTLLKDSLKNDDLHDQFINKLFELERRRFALQLVPYMPIHPAQLNTGNTSAPAKTDEQPSNSTTPVPMQTSEVKKDNGDHVFKRPFTPLPYTVEEPCESTAKRPPRMKRSYSQSVRYNSNLTVVELKNDARDSSALPSQSDYYILEPSTPALAESPASRSSASSLPANASTVQITEFFDFPPSIPSVEPPFSLSFGACDQMDDSL